MSSTDQQVAKAAATAAMQGPKTLDDLARLGTRELEALYAAAKAPRVEDLDGALVGRMLAMPATAGSATISRALRKFAAADSFPWQGKTFRTLSDGRGEGKNRVL